MNRLPARGSRRTPEMNRLETAAASMTDRWIGLNAFATEIPVGRFKGKRKTKQFRKSWSGPAAAP